MASTTCVFALLSMNSSLLPQITPNCPLGQCNIRITDLRKCRIECPKPSELYIEGLPGNNKGPKTGDPKKDGKNSENPDGPLIAPSHKKNGTNSENPDGPLLAPIHKKNGTNSGNPDGPLIAPSHKKNGTNSGNPDGPLLAPIHKKNGTNSEIPDSELLVPAPDAPGYMICKAASGFMYKYHKQEATYKQAERACRADGALLPSIHSTEENECIYRLSRNKTKDILDIHETVWIGLRRVGESFMWIDESQLNYQNWAKREPNNLGGKENCASIYTKGIDCAGENDYLKRWNDLPCDFKLSGGFVCKKYRRKN